MNKKNETMKNQPQGENQNWVFIPLCKKHILKRTEGYVLFDVDGVASGIVNGKFIRKKESDTMIYMSLPLGYEVTCRVRENVNGKWTTVKEYIITSQELREIVIAHNKDDLPF